MDTLSTIEVIPLHDVAIDLVRSDLSEYARTRDLAHVVLTDGARPERWWIRPLTLSERRAIRSLATDEDRYEGAFVRGVVRGEWRDRAGAWRSYVRADEAPMRDDVLGEIPEASVLEIGMVALARSILPFGSPVPWPLPRGSQAALQARLLRSAALPTTSAPSGSGARAEAPPTTSAPRSAPPGDATAETPPAS